MVDASARVETTEAQRSRPRRQQGVPLTLLALLLISLFATGASVSVLFVPGAVVAAVFAAIFYLMFMAARIRQRRAAGSDAGSALAATTVAPGDPDEVEIAPDVDREIVIAERAGLKTVLIIAVPLVILAVVMAAVIFGWKAIGLGALFLFAVMAFMGAPVWLAAVEDDIDDEEERVGIERHSIR